MLQLHCTLHEHGGVWAVWVCGCLHAHTCLCLILVLLLSVDYPYPASFVVHCPLNINISNMNIQYIKNRNLTSSTKGGCGCSQSQCHCHCRPPLVKCKVAWCSVVFRGVCVCRTSHSRGEWGRERGTSVPPSVAQYPCAHPPSAPASGSALGLLLLRLLPVQLYPQENFIPIALSK